MEYQNATEQPASLEEETRTVIEEARMILPGIQAFFGFQLIAIFNNRFQDLTQAEQVLHLVAELASRCLECAMFPFMLSIAVDLFLLSRLILDNRMLSSGIALSTVLMFFSLWYAFPWTHAARARRQRRSSSNPGR